MRLSENDIEKLKQYASDMLGHAVSEDEAVAAFMRTIDKTVESHHKWISDSRKKRRKLRHQARKAMN